MLYLEVQAYKLESTGVSRFTGLVIGILRFVDGLHQKISWLHKLSHFY